MDKIDIKPAYIPPNLTLMAEEWKLGSEKGDPSRITALNEVFAWKRGFVNGWYGWSNDGKGTFFDFTSLVKSKVDGWKWCFFKQEDMSSRRRSKKDIVMTADDIYNNIAWQLTAKTPYKDFAIRNSVEQIPFDEYMNAIEWVEKHFFVVYPSDRSFKSVKDTFLFYYERFGIDGFLIDPWKSVITDRSKETVDQVLNNCFIELKEFALKTDTCVNIIAHPKSMSDVKVSNKEDAAYKVVNQFMISGGAAWDNNMDSQYSIYRPERHIKQSDPKVHFINLKQRKAEIVGARRGTYEKIIFDNLTKRYFFDGVCPLDGSVLNDKFSKSKVFSEPLFQPEPSNPFAEHEKEDPDKTPF